MSRDRWGQRVLHSGRACHAGHALGEQVATSADGSIEERYCEEHDQGCWASPHQSPVLVYCPPSEATEDVK